MLTSLWSARAPEKIVAIATCTLLAGMILSVGIGAARYLEGKDARLSLLVEAEMKALSVAQRMGERGLRVGRDGDGFAAAVQVVMWGGKDEFGISRGSRVVLDEVSDPRLDGHRVVGDGLLERSKAIEGWLSGPNARAYEAMASSARLGLVEGAGYLGAGAAAPLLGADGIYVGMVQVVVTTETPASPVSIWRALLGLFLAVLMGWLARNATGGRFRLACAAAAVVSVGAVLALAGATLALWFASVGGLVAYLAGPGLRHLLLGVWRQPRTYLYVAPAVVAMVVLVFIPFGMGVTLSLFDDTAGFRGLENFAEILSPSRTSDPSFYWTLGMTVVWTVLNVVLHVAIGLGLALALNRPDLRGRGVYRVLLIVPWAVPSYITALIWKWMFNTQYGAVNAMLAVFGVDRIDWLGDSVVTNFLANLVTNTWLGFPFMMVVALGALQSIPKDLYEAATIDGASRVQAFRHVTLPLLKPAMVPAIILGTIWTFNMFNVIYLVSGGAPDGKTNILITQAYHAFKVLERDGYAAAYALLIFVILWAYGWMTDRITRASEGVYT